MGATGGSDHRRAEGDEAGRQGRAHAVVEDAGERDTRGAAHEAPRLAATACDSGPAGDNDSCEGGYSTRSSSAGDHHSSSEGGDSDPGLEGKEGGRAGAASYRVQGATEQARVG